MAPFEVIMAVIAATAVIIAAISVYYKWKDRQLKLDVLRVKESLETPYETDWSIRILHPTKAISKCNILYYGVPLKWSEIDEGYNKYFGINHFGKARIPRHLTNEVLIERAKVLVRDGEKVISKYRFKDIPIYKQ